MLTAEVLRPIVALEVRRITDVNVNSPLHISGLIGQYLVSKERRRLIGVGQTKSSVGGVEGLIREFAVNGAYSVPFIARCSYSSCVDF